MAPLWRFVGVVLAVLTVLTALDSDDDLTRTVGLGLAALAFAVLALGGRDDRWRPPTWERASSAGEGE